MSVVEVPFRSKELNSSRIHVLSLQDQLSDADTLQTLPSTILNSIHQVNTFALYERDIEYVRNLGENYIRTSADFEEIQSKLLSHQGDLVDILALTTVVVDENTREHEDYARAGWQPPLRDYLRKDSEYTVRCAIYQDIFIEVFTILLQQFGKEDLAEIYKLIDTHAVVSPDIRREGIDYVFADTINIPHGFLSILSLHEDGVVEVSPIDPYWTRGENVTPSNVAEVLDFTHSRSMDSLLTVIDSDIDIRREYTIAEEDLDEILGGYKSITENKENIADSLGLEYAYALAILINNIQFGLDRIQEKVEDAEMDITEYPHVELYINKKARYESQIYKLKDIQDVLHEKMLHYINQQLVEVQDDSNSFPEKSIVDLVSIIDYCAVHAIPLDKDVWEKIQTRFFSLAKTVFGSRDRIDVDNLYMLKYRFLKDITFIPFYKDEQQLEAYTQAKLGYLLLGYALFGKLPEYFVPSRSNLEDACERLFSSPKDSWKRRGQILADNYEPFIAAIEEYFSGQSE